MSAQKPEKVPADDRSMQPEEGRSQMFFFPKRYPPVSVRAASREEAERVVEAQGEPALETPNHEKND